MEYYLLNFTDKETGSERLVNVPNITQPESGRSWMQIQVTWLQNMHCSLLRGKSYPEASHIIIAIL